MALRVKPHQRIAGCARPGMASYVEACLGRFRVAGFMSTWGKS